MLCGKKPLTRLATLATLSPREKADIHQVDGPLPRGEGWTQSSLTALSLGERHLRFEVKVFLMCYTAASGL
jgi:hypothetical protein